MDGAAAITPARRHDGQGFREQPLHASCGSGMQGVFERTVVEQCLHSV